MASNGKCPEKECDGEMIWISKAGWLAGKRLICSNPFCPGKKLPEAMKAGLSMRKANE